MVLLDRSAFLTRLNKLYEDSKTKGSVFITMKRYVGKPLLTRAQRKKGDKIIYSSEDEPKCLVRVSDGKKNKFSTLILAKDTAKFHSDLNTLMRPQMLSLKKHQKKRKQNQN